MMLNNSGVLDGGVHDAAAAQRGGGHHHHHHHQRGLKKGPWTAAEDAILMEYVKKHGEGNWNAVQKNSGLTRCGKSCRLRWANHLRPNLKKGSLSPEEERLIIELHAKLGNKWARMASQLPGRTDNEIKNYWNTRMKRRQRAGLPVYPHELQQEASAAASAFHHLHHPQHHHQHVRNSSSSSSASSFSSLLSASSHKPNFTSPTHLSLYDHITHNNPNNNYSLHPNSSSLYPMTNQFNGNGGFSMTPLSPVSPFGSSPSSAMFSTQSQNIRNQTLLSTNTSASPLLHPQYNSHGGFGGNYNNLSTLSSMIMGPPTYDPTAALVPTGSNSELPSNQTPPNFNGGEGQMGASSEQQLSQGNGEHYEIAPMPSQGNSGLLDDVLVEAQNISNKKSKSDGSWSGVSAKEKGPVVEEEEDDDTAQVESAFINSGENSVGNHRDDSSSPSSIGMKENEDPLEEMDDDLLSLLNFPAAMPAVSDQSWYHGCMSNRPTSMTGIVSTSENVGLEIQQNVPLPSPVKTNDAAPDQVKNTLAASCYWNNMPGIC